MKNLEIFENFSFLNEKEDSYPDYLEQYDKVLKPLGFLEWPDYPLGRDARVTHEPHEPWNWIGWQNEEDLDPPYEGANYKGRGSRLVSILGIFPKERWDQNYSDEPGIPSKNSYTSIWIPCSDSFNRHGSSTYDDNLKNFIGTYSKKYGLKDWKQQFDDIVFVYQELKKLGPLESLTSSILRRNFVPLVLKRGFKPAKVENNYTVGEAWERDDQFPQMWSHLEIFD